MSERIAKEPREAAGGTMGRGAGSGTEAPPPHFRRNFSLAVANGVIYSGADACLDPNTVLPLFLSRLTGSHALIGLGSSLASVGWFSPQIVMSNVVEGRAYKLPVYRFSAVIRVASLAILAALVPWLAAKHPAELLISFFLLFGLYALGGGFAGVSFMDVVAKTVPPSRRGYLWSLRLGLGGVLAVAIGWGVRRILEARPFPSNFAVIFGCASTLVFVSLALFSFCIEPPDRIVSRRPTLNEHVREAFRVLREDKLFRRLFRARMLFGLWAMASPFYALFATQKLGFPARTAGTFLIAQTLGMVFSNIIWGRLSAGRGDVIVLRRATWLAVAAPVLAIAASLAKSFAPQTHLALPLLACTLFLVGAVTSGVGVGYPNLLLGLAPEGRRTAYIGFMNSFIAPILVLPTIGGLLVDTAGYLVVFSASALFAAAAFGSARKLSVRR